MHNKVHLLRYQSSWHVLPGDITSFNSTQTRKHQTMAQWRFIVGPSSLPLTQRKINIGSVSHAYWVLTMTQQTQNICTTSAQRLLRLSNIVQMLYKCVVFTEHVSIWCLVVFLLLGSDFSSCKITQHGLEYTGSVSQTRWGRRCRYWSDTIQTVPESESNYCRNTDYSADGPWCFTVDTPVTD